MVETVRTFIAADLPPSVREEMAKIQARLMVEKCNIRWVKPENIHLTLVFLGDVHPEILGRVHLAVTEAVRQYPVIHLSAEGLGVFPGIKRPRVVWTGLTGDVDILRKLRVSLEHSLVRVSGLNDKREKRPFRAHLTLGRIKGRINRRKLAAAMNQLQGVPSVPIAVEAIHVFKSDLRIGGAVYTKLHSSRLT